MADSVAVFPPGFRVTDDSTGEPVSGAILYFYDAGTTSGKTVYGDEDLTVEIGTAIVCDTLGYPTSDGSSTKTLIYVGTTPYKVVCKDASGEIWSHDNVKGAVVSAASLNISVTATFPVVTKSLDYNVLATDQNTTFKVNCSAGDVTLTLPSAVTVGTGWKIKVQHAGSANQALIAVATGSGQLIAEGSKSFGGGYALALNGEDLEITSDGGNWLVSSHTAPFFKMSQGIVPIVDRVSSAPVSPVQGDVYLSTASATWSGEPVGATDIVQWSGSAWVPFTPYTDCGWMLYVKTENRNYQYRDSAWVALSADQAAMEAATDANAHPTVLTQRLHPGHPKAWVSCTGGGTIRASHNISSVVRNATGQFVINFSFSFANLNYGWAGGAANFTGTSFLSESARNTNSLNVTTVAGGSVSDGVPFSVILFGDT